LNDLRLLAALAAVPDAFEETSYGGYAAASLSNSPHGRREITDLKRDGMFIGSCTNAWLEDLRAVAHVVGCKIVNSNVKAMIVPGLGLVKEQVEAAAAAIAGHFVDVRERH
jgi:homoaconitase/3-isopropylmalate dehydratase large subunit